MKFLIKFLLSFVLTSFLYTVFAQDPMNFELHSVTDNSHFVLSEAKGKYVALHFLLKTECPFCLKHTQDYISKAENIPDVIQVFIKPDTDEEIREWAKYFSADELSKFPIYQDADAKLAKRFNIPGGYYFHSQKVNYPALVVLGRNGKEVFRYIGKNNSDRFSFEKLENKIAELERLKNN